MAARPCGTALYLRLRSDRAAIPASRPCRVAIGFTSRGAKGKAIGECWDNRRIGDGHFEIFIRPDLAHAPDAMPAQIAAILAHELVHAAVGIAAGHGRAFKRVSVGLGLVGPMRATTPRGRLPFRHCTDPRCGRSPSPCQTRYRQRDYSAQEAGGADAEMRVLDVRLYRQDRAQMAGDSGRAFVPG